MSARPADPRKLLEMDLPRGQLSTDVGPAGSFLCQFWILTLMRSLYVDNCLNDRYADLTLG